MGLSRWRTRSQPSTAASSCESCARYRVPAVYAWGYFVTMGGLASYGVDQVDIFRRAALYLDRILRGDAVGDLPVQAPTKFELMINLSTAKAVWPCDSTHATRALADEVIE